MDSNVHANLMLDNREHEFLVKYHNINSKLKKRFMRNPNVNEACEQFISLSIECEQKKAWQYAALCYLAISRCYHQLGNTGTAIIYSLRAGKFFLRAHKQNNKFGCPSIGSENIEAACNSLISVSKQLQDEQKFDVNVAGSIFHLAISLGSTSAGCYLLKKSINIFSTVRAIDTLISFYIKQGDYITALNTVIELMELIETICVSTDYYRNLLRKAEINKVLLLLTLQPTIHRLPSNYFEMISKYKSIDDNSGTNTYLNENEYLLLQSLVLVCQSRDEQAILNLESELWQFIDADQKDLLRILVQGIISE
ncbi:40-kDa huntingtin-associated protein [Chelonus insularis]|uniref:40-kDa huntingtin-associated protein n=1 Tax=Chelonus insularis TaxID=460826 RepID=UPI00158E18CC|nr:40-kDa huntingtin-associated protein-like [Chelonus insularis]